MLKWEKNAATFSFGYFFQALELYMFCLLCKQNEWENYYEEPHAAHIRLIYGINREIIKPKKFKLFYERRFGRVHVKK